jgi:hypothetical protein
MVDDSPAMLNLLGYFHHGSHITVYNRAQSSSNLSSQDSLNAA